MTQRVDELLSAAVHDEREVMLRKTLKQLADANTRISELERSHHAGAAHTFESTHRSAVTLTQSIHHVERLESQLRDALRDAVTQLVRCAHRQSLLVCSD